MPCCGGHGGNLKFPVSILSSRPTSSDDVAGDALLNLSVLKTLSEHVDAATAVSCYSVCRAWREAFGLSCLNSTMCTSEPVDGTRSRFASNLHGAVTLEVTQPAPNAQRGFDRHVAALARNRHFVQLKVHLPVREASEPQLSLGTLTALAPLTQLSSLVVARNPAFTSAPHVLTEEDVTALATLRPVTFLELCTAVPPPLGLGPMASMVATSLTQLRTLAFGHTSALWRIPQVAALCRLLDVCPLMTDLRLRCCAPPRDAKQLPDLMSLSLPQRLTNFALTFARRLGRGENGGGAGGAGGGAAAAAAAAAAALAAAGPAGGGADDDDDEVEYGEYEEMDEPWDSVDHLAPKPGLHVLIVEKGTRVTRMDVNITISVPASELPTISLPAAASSSADQGGSAAAALPSTRTGVRGSRSGGGSSAAAGATSSSSSARAAGALTAAAAEAEAGPSGSSAGALEGSAAAKSEDSGSAAAGASSSAAAIVAATMAAAGAGAGGNGGDERDDEEDVPPYDVTPLVVSEYDRLLQQELGLTGPLAQPEDLHLGVRLDILEDEDEGLAAAAAAFNHAHNLQGFPAIPLVIGGNGGGGAGGGGQAGGPAHHQHFLQVAAQIEAAFQAAQQAAQQQQQQQGAGAGAGVGGGGGGAGGNGGGGGLHALFPALLAALEGAAGGGGGQGGGGGGAGGGGGGGVAFLMNQLGQLHLGGGGGGGAAAVAPGALVPNAQHHQHGPGGAGGGGGGGGAAGRRAAAPLAARAVQLQLGPLSRHMCYLNLAVVPMVTQLAMVGPGLGPNGEEVVQHPQPSDTRVAPVLLDVRGGGYTQLKSLAITGFVDQECRPACWMSRGWLGRVPAGMPCLEYLALYDTLPATATDPEAVEGLRNLAHLEHLELRPLYLRFTGEVACPLTVPPRVLPAKLLQLTLKKVSIPAPPPLPPGVAHGSPAALAVPGLPDFPVLTHLWLFDCTAPDLTVFRRATRLEDLRLGGTTTTTRLRDLLAPWQCLRGVILDVSHSAAPGWWSAEEMSALSGLRCLRSLQLDAASMEPPPPPPVTGPQSATAAGGGAAAAAAAAAGPRPRVSLLRSLQAAGALGAAATPAPLYDSDDDSDNDTYLSTEEDAAPAAAAAGAAAAPEAAAAGGGSGPSSAYSTDLASVLTVLAGLTQLTDLTLSFDTPTLFFDPEDEEAEEYEETEDNGGQGGGPQGAAGQGLNSDDDDIGDSDDEDEEDDDEGSDGDMAAGPSGAAKAKRSGAAAAAGDERSHADRVYDALLSGQSFVSLAALQGLWRLRIGLPHGTVWEDMTDRLLPMLRLAMPRTMVEMDVL